MQRALELEKSTGVSGCATHCPYCALQCGMNLKSTAEHSWAVVERDFPTNRGGLCQKGWTATELLENPGRLRTPLVRDRRSEPLRAATWEDALERIACAIERTQAAHGRNAAGIFGGGSLTNEKAYLRGKFARVALKTSQRSSGVYQSLRHRSRPALPRCGHCPGRDDSAGGQQPGGDHAASHALLSGAEAPRRIADGSRPARHAYSRLVYAAPPDHAWNRCRAGQRTVAHCGEGRVYR